MQSVFPQDEGWTVSAGYESDQFDAVIMAAPRTCRGGAACRAADANLARELAEIQL